MNASQNEKKATTTNHFITTPFDANNVEKFPKIMAKERKKIPLLNRNHNDNKYFFPLVDVLIVAASLQTQLKLNRIILYVYNTFFGCAFRLASVYGNTAKIKIHGAKIDYRSFARRKNCVHLFVTRVPNRNK